MIVRIVRMAFKEEEVGNFLKLFNSVRDKILSFEGCSSLQLLRKEDEPATLFTISHWESDESLQRYRNSPLFISTWKKTKSLFAEKAEAWSMEPVFSSNDAQ